MAKPARQIYKDIRAAGWKPGQALLENEGFEVLSEACGCDTDGRTIEGATRDIHLGDDADGYRIRDLAENLIVNKSDGEPVGRRFIQDYFDPQRKQHLLESGAWAAVDSSMFMGVTGQLMVTQILQPFQKEEYKIRKLIPTYNSNLEQEKWIGLAEPADPNKNLLRVQEQEPYKRFGFGEVYVQTPITRKEGAIIGLTKEAIFFDRTGQITQRASQVGDMLAFSEEKECIGALIGSTTDPTYFVEKRQFDSAPVTLDLFQYEGSQSGAYQLAYAHASRLYPFYNDIAANPLYDYRSLRTADQYFARTLDPDRGRPIVLGKPFVLAPYAKRMDYYQATQAESLWKMSSGGLTAAGGLNTISRNPVEAVLGLPWDQVLFSRQLELELQAQLGITQAQAELVWFYGDIAEAFAYVTNWPVTVQSAPTNSEIEFNQDIVMQWKASKRGRVAIKSPRHWQRHNMYGVGTQGSGS